MPAGPRPNTIGERKAVVSMNRCMSSGGAQPPRRGIQAVRTKTPRSFVDPPLRILHAEALAPAIGARPPTRTLRRSSDLQALTKPSGESGKDRRPHGFVRAC